MTNHYQAVSETGCFKSEGPEINVMSAVIQWLSTLKIRLVLPMIFFLEACQSSKVQY